MADPLKVLAVALVVSLAVGSCAADDRLSLDELSGRAFASSSATELGRPFPLVPGTRFLVHFGHRLLWASAGCNEMGGRITGLPHGRLVLKDDSLNITGMACPDRQEQESWLSDILGGRPRIELAGEKLVLTVGNRRAEFVEQHGDTRALLVGPVWAVTAVVTAGVPTPVADSPDIVFTKDGRFVQRRAGCDEASGRIDFERGTIRVRSWSARSCPAPEGEPVVLAGPGRVVVDRMGALAQLRYPSGDGFDLRAR